MNSSREIQGARTAHRAVQILKLLAAHHGEGMTIPDIIKATGVQRSAVQRALQCLLEEDLAERGINPRRYHLGIEAMHLGRAAMLRSPLVSAYSAVLKRLARMTGETVYLGVRMGDFVMCLHREEGGEPVRVQRVEIGELRPLGTTAGGLALLVHAEDDELTRLYQRHVAAFRAARMDLDDLRQKVGRVRRFGYATLKDTVGPGRTGIGIALGHSEPYATVSVGLMNSRANAEQLQKIDGLLREAQVVSNGRRFEPAVNSSKSRPTLRREDPAEPTT